ncbi:MAG: hypothetical protein AUJ28_02750 [Parcubacteria group bacterium CG1_02_37_51]|uniref:Transposase IS30-like HTH domain-containing protein n=2 Tax=Candidatus Komeiliibacteriota TaxID=1817908 RepID=A0A2M8DRW6_9BACT|nr:MAG: hypothetical protein AUJ28_02750 [Parcubacteria group bacterium CG1_02_37_51]PIY95305.1 MAG: hypothetical protein COY67_00625 [Candidatus Komeilibacteria bacterium CG_4_10_14_0_8_um_filter_37_78]PJC02122.1 MAG: hypothetical protein CO073_01105 [Candidatus Komeilibacteria bacterium CG_4_9_14_0_8_um_filter_36_9]
MRSYNQFTQEDRIILSLLIRRGFKQAEIAREINKSQSAISRELNRNKQNNNIYHAGTARRMYLHRQIKAHYYKKRIESNKWLEEYIVKQLKLYWSPEQISGRLRKNYEIVICHETIYKYIYNRRRDLKRYLRCQKGRYRRRYGTRIREKRREEAKKKRIDKRPIEVEIKERLGDFEGDTIVGKEKNIHILTHVDRRSGILFADKLEHATAQITKE